MTKELKKASVPKKKKKKPVGASPAERAERYATECVMGVRDVPEPIKKAYRKWFEYKKKYKFNKKRLNKMCALIEMMSLPETEGDRKEQEFRLQDWQCALLSWIFGFYTDKGNRAVRQVHLIIPRKAGKSSLAASVLLAELMEPTGGGTKPEILLMGVNTETSDIVYGKIISILEGDRRRHKGILRKRYKLSHTKHRVKSDKHGGYIEKISANARTLDGKTARLVFVDEIAALPTADPIDILASGLGHAKNSLIFTATTPGNLPVSAMQPIRENVLRWLDDDDDLGKSIGLLYEAKIEDEYDDPKVWRRVQPSMDKIVDESFYEEDCRKAGINDALKRTFETRYLCKPLSGGSVWVGQTDLEALPADPFGEQGPPLHPDVRYYVGCDFSEVSDTTSICLLAVNERAGWQNARWIVYYPKGNSLYENPDTGLRTELHAGKTHKYYQEQEQKGFVKLCTGRTMNHTMVAHDLGQMMARYNPHFVVVDNYDCVHDIRSRLIPEFQHRFLMMSKTPAKVSAPARHLETWIKNKTISFQKNDVVMQHFLNTHVVQQPTGGLRLEKPTASSAHKIDAVDALVNAVAGYLESTELKNHGTDHNPIRNDIAAGGEDELTGEDLMINWA